MLQKHQLHSFCVLIPTRGLPLKLPVVPLLISSLLNTICDTGCSESSLPIILRLLCNFFYTSSELATCPLAHPKFMNDKSYYYVFQWLPFIKVFESSRRHSEHLLKYNRLFKRCNEFEDLFPLYSLKYP